MTSVSPLAAARHYYAEGWMPIPVPFRSKEPTLTEWQHKRWSADDLPRHFNGTSQNIGVLPGVASGGLADCDLDCPEAVALAPTLMPATNRISGREKRPQSHRFYQVMGDFRTVKFRDPIRTRQHQPHAMILELRYNKLQTLVWPSIGPEGDRYLWYDEGPPAKVDADELRIAGIHTAIAVLAGRYWPGQGGRHEAALYWSGLLKNGGIRDERVQAIIRAAAEAAGDDEVEDRVRAAEDTCACAKRGEAYSGGTSLVELLGDEIGGLIVKQVQRWALPKADIGGALPRHATKDQNDPEEDLADDEGATDGEDRPSIRVDDRGLEDVVKDGFAALVAANDPPTTFVRGGALVRVVRDEDGRPLIASHTVDSLRVRLAECASWYEVVGKGRKPRREVVAPPSDVVRAIRDLGQWAELPPLAGITQTPILHDDGTIHDTDGYDPLARLWYAPSATFHLPPVPVAPGPDDVRAAVAAIADVLCDFPFLGDADRAAVWAGILTATLRPVILGPTPMLIIDKPRAGTGASLLAEVIARIATGGPAQMRTLPKDRADEEIRKVITAALLAGNTAILFDNVETAIRSGPLAAAITARVWEDRLLGRSETVRLPVRVSWTATGNNVRVAGDFARRCIVLRLDARVERPWERTDFRHPDLLAYMDAHRGELVGAVLTLARAWMRAGRPAGDNPTLGSFEAWSRIVGGILTYAGIRGFMSNLAEFYAAADEDYAEWAGFLDALHAWSRGEPFTVAQLAGLLGDDGFALVRDALPGYLAEKLGKPTLRHALGRALASKAEARFGSLRLVKAGEMKRAAQWQTVADPPPDAPNERARRQSR